MIWLLYCVYFVFYHHSGVMDILPKMFSVFRRSMIWMSVAPTGILVIKAYPDEW